MNQKKSLKTNSSLKRKNPLRAKAKEKSKFEVTEVRTKKCIASRKTIMRNADDAFSLYVRTRDAQQYDGRAFRCVSCGRVLPIEQADCGHYVNRQHMSLRFSELNCHAQCRKCNRFMEGNIQDYRKGLIGKIGEQKVLLLESTKHVTSKITNFELELLAKHYKDEIKKFQYQIK